jgi:6-phosphofructokinase 2
MNVAPPVPIVTLTLNPCIDESASVERLVPDRKLRCGKPRYEPGGASLRRNGGSG